MRWCCCFALSVKCCNYTWSRRSLHSKMLVCCFFHFIWTLLLARRFAVLFCYLSSFEMCRNSRLSSHPPFHSSFPLTILNICIIRILIGGDTKNKQNHCSFPFQPTRNNRQCFVVLGRETLVDLLKEKLTHNDQTCTQRIVAENK